MGIYLNPDNTDFQEALNSEIYVDKTELIKHTNSKIRTTNVYMCQSPQKIRKIYGWRYACSILQQRLRFKRNVQPIQNIVRSEL